MNFYIGSTIEDLKINDRSVEFSDDLLEYLNKNKTILHVPVYFEAYKDKVEIEIAK